MSEKQFYCDEFGEYRSYAIYDCSKVEKTKEDFWDNGEEGYDIIAYKEYLEENDCMLISNEVEDMLNELSEENGQLKKVNNLLYNENIQLRRILVNYKDLIYDVKYLEEKGVFDGEKDKKNIWDVEPVVEKHS